MDNIIFSLTGLQACSKTSKYYDSELAMSEILRRTIAIVYDYDHTLSPLFMQDDVLLPELQIGSDTFWFLCAELVKEGFENELAYMKMILDCAGRNRPTNAHLRDIGARLTLFEGLPEMLDDFRARVLTPDESANGIRLEQYILSAGLKVMIEGSRLGSYVNGIFGCEFAEDKDGRISFPKRVINHTQKTQYLFRISKGMLEPSQNVNDHVPTTLRPIPFSNMIYVGDGLTDVPCFAVMRAYDGRCIAVYNPRDPTRSGFKKCYELRSLANRVHHIAPADYREGKQARLLLEEMIHEIAGRIIYGDSVMPQAVQA